MIGTHAVRPEQEGRPWRPFSVAALLALCLATPVLGCSTLAAQEPQRRSAGRLAPPAAIDCDRNRLTSWFGVVSGYRRQSGQTWLEISTDYDTVEHTTIEHAGQPDASAHFLLWGERFMARDWAKIEQSPGMLIKGMRAVVWVCDDGKTAAVVDWQPVRGDHGSR